MKIWVFVVGMVVCMAGVGCSEAQTMDLPDIRSGFVYHSSKISPSLSMTLYDKEVTKYRNAIFDVGISNDYAFASAGVELIPVVSITPFVAYGYDLDKESWRAGAGLSVIKF